MSSINDWMGLYGAALASFLAIIQFKQWRRSSEKLWIKLYPEYDFRNGSNVEITVTNVASQSIYIEFIGIGLCYRPWFSPWRIVFGDISCLKITKNGCYDDHQASGEMKSGAIWDLWFDAKDKTDLKVEPFRWRGFFHRPCLWVDYSVDNQGFRKILKWKD